MRQRPLFSALAGLTLAVGALSAVGASPATAAGVADIKINEIESAPTGQGTDVRDWVELINTGTATVDASGLVLRGTENATGAGFVLPSGSTLAPGARRAYDVDVDVAGGFQLRDADTLRLLTADGVTTLDTYSWTTPAATTYGRCPDGTGAFTVTLQPTKGAANACPSTPVPPTPTTADTTPPKADVRGLTGSKVYTKPPKVLCLVTDNTAGPSCKVALDIKAIKLASSLKAKLVVQAKVTGVDAAGNTDTAKKRFIALLKKRLPTINPQPQKVIDVTGVKDGKSYSKPPTPGCTTVGNDQVASCSVQLYNVLAKVGATKREVIRVLAVVRGFSATGTLVDTATKTFTTRVP